MYLFVVKKVGIILDGRLAKIKARISSMRIISFTGFGLFFGLLLASEALIYEYIKREI